MYTNKHLKAAESRLAYAIMHFNILRRLTHVYKLYLAWLHTVSGSLTSRHFTKLCRSLHPGGRFHLSKNMTRCEATLVNQCIIQVHITQVDHLALKQSNASVLLSTAKTKPAAGLRRCMNVYSAPELVSKVLLFTCAKWLATTSFWKSSILCGIVWTWTVVGE